MHVEETMWFRVYILYNCIYYEQTLDNLIPELPSYVVVGLGPYADGQLAAQMVPFRLWSYIHRTMPSRLRQMFLGDFLRRWIIAIRLDCWKMVSAASEMSITAPFRGLLRKISYMPRISFVETSRVC